MINFLSSRNNQEPVVMDLGIPRGLDDFFNFPLFFNEKFLYNPLAVDVYEKDNKVVVNAEIPGVDKKTLKVSLNSDILTISGQKKQEYKTKKENYYRAELRHAEFKRSIQLPIEVKSEGIKAVCEEGILTIELPKAELKQLKAVNIDFK